MDVKDFTKISEEKLFKAHVFDVAKYTYTLPTGVDAARTVVEHRGSVVFMPVTDDGMLVLTRQYRIAVNEVVLEFPAGSFDHDGESPLDCAMREICEEVGYEAKKWTDLGYHFPSPGYCNHREYAFVARELSPKSLHGPEEEIIEPVHMSPLDFEQAIKDGVIRDSKSIALYMQAKLLGIVNP